MCKLGLLPTYQELWKTKDYKTKACLALPYTPLWEVNQANISLVVIDNMFKLGLFPTCQELWNKKDCLTKYTHL